VSIAQGRCAGCGDMRALKDSEWHVTACPAWARLFREDPDLALDPAAELARWAEQDRGAERAADLRRRTADTVASRAASCRRFATVDLLGDADDLDRTVGGAVRRT
jgi:hypothetical protein